jgi:hypothetical protein
MPERYGWGDCFLAEGLSCPQALIFWFGDNFSRRKEVLKQQVVSTSLGQLTVSSLTLGELRQLDSLFSESSENLPKGLSSLLKYLPVIFSSLRKVHHDLSLDALEGGLTLDDFNLLFSAVLEVSGLKKAAPGEAAPVTA